MRAPLHALCTTAMCALLAVACGKESTPKDNDKQGPAGSSSSGANTSGSNSGDDAGESGDASSSGGDALTRYRTGGPLCPGGAVNDEGLGKACKTAKDCEGLAAVTCPADVTATGVQFCTKYCFKLKPDECGANGKCVDRGKGQSICAPTKCADKVHLPRGPFVEAKVPCDGQQPNSHGVGKACKKHVECKENTIAKSCAYAFNKANPPWCSLLCSHDKDCGPDAFCWERPANSGPGLVRSCALVACITKDPTGKYLK